MNIELHLRVVGTLLLLLAGINFLVPKRFHWKEELSRLSLLNRQIFHVHYLFIIVVVVMMGLLSAVFTRSLLDPTPLAAYVLAGLCFFWTLRLFVQWFVYDSKLWRGNPFNTGVHIVFSFLWVYFSLVYGWAFCLQCSARATPLAIF